MTILTKQDEHDKEIKRLLDGYEKFRAHYFANDGKNPLYKKLVQYGQSPKTMIIACSDSRVDPSTILSCSPGELFVVRNVANLVPPCDDSPKHHGTSAALEFAVRQLGVHHIIVLGHSHCGGIQALLGNIPQESATDKSFIASWMEIAKSARDNVLRQKNLSADERAKICEEQSLLISIENLKSFPWIREKVQQGTLTLHAWRFDLTSGIIQRFETHK